MIYCQPPTLFGHPFFVGAVKQVNTKWLAQKCELKKGFFKDYYFYLFTPSTDYLITISVELIKVDNR